ncbi:hypothetical protein ABFX02_10G027300 [Erythranthe guttata]
MLEGKAIVRETDMPDDLSNRAMELAYQALDLHESSEFQSIARFIKKNFDEFYGPTWHCVVGKDFGSCITHLNENYIMFCVDMIVFLLFKDGDELSHAKEEAVIVPLQKPVE